MSNFAFHTRPPTLVTDVATLMNIEGSLDMRLTYASSDVSWANAARTRQGDIVPFRSVAMAPGVVGPIAIPVMFVYSNDPLVSARSGVISQVLEVNGASVMLVGQEPHIAGIAQRAAAILAEIPVASGTYISVLTNPSHNDAPIREDSWELAFGLAVMGAGPIMASGTWTGTFRWELVGLKAKAKLASELKLPLYVHSEELPNQGGQPSVELVGARFRSDGFRIQLTPGQPIVAFDDKASLYFGLFVNEYAVRKARASTQAAVQAETRRIEQENPMSEQQIADTLQRKLNNAVANAVRALPPSVPDTQERRDAVTAFQRVATWLSKHWFDEDRDAFTTFYEATIPVPDVPANKKSGFMTLTQTSIGTVLNAMGKDTVQSFDKAANAFGNLATSVLSKIAPLKPQVKQLPQAVTFKGSQGPSVARVTDVMSLLQGTGRHQRQAPVAVGSDASNAPEEQRRPPSTAAAASGPSQVRGSSLAPIDVDAD